MSESAQQLEQVDQAVEAPDGEVTAGEVASNGASAAAEVGGQAVDDASEDAEDSEDSEDVEDGEDGEDAEAELDPEVRARRDAALANVRKFGDPVLKTRAKPVERFDEALRDEVQRLTEWMSDGLGIGLAATQVGILNRVFVYRVQPDAPVGVLVNPEIEWRSREEEVAEEGCLSLPMVHVDVERPVHVRATALDEHGEPIVIEASGLEARVILHELDHLDGVLILDRTSRDQRRDAMRALREWQAGDGR